MQAGQGPARALDRAVTRAADALMSLQKRDGEWSFALEADATIPAEYILLGHYLGEPDTAAEPPLAHYLRTIQGAHGGWPLFHGGAFDISASVKAYFALKAAGDAPDAPHMARARAAILARGGAAACNANVFTRIQLALFGEAAVDYAVADDAGREILQRLPRWFPFHLSKIFVLVAHRARSAAPGC